MKVKPPDPANLPASRQWVRRKFALASQYRGALRQVDKSLAAIAEYELSFLLSRAGLLTCLERWPELVALLQQLINCHPDELEVWDEVAGVFMAHGDYASCLAVHRRARPLVAACRIKSQLELHYWSYLECLYAAGRRKQALVEGRRLLHRHPRFSLIRAELSSIEANRLRVEPWAPSSASYLKELRELAT